MEELEGESILQGAEHAGLGPRVLHTSQDQPPTAHIFFGRMAYAEPRYIYLLFPRGEVKCSLEQIVTCLRVGPDL